MKKSIRDTTNKRGRPKTTGPGLSVQVRLHPNLLEPLDEWMQKQRDYRSRPEAIREILERVLKPKRGQ